MIWSKTNFTKWCVGVLGVMLALLALMQPEAAKADPHAVFYTATGQQQLFFNILAALDQADYVETAFARAQIAERRQGVDTEPRFEEEDVELVRESEISSFERADPNAQRSSQPGTPTLLNRQVTLEGSDLYTDQLVRLFGAEHARRNSLSELLVTLCEFGLGVPGCELDLRKMSAQEIAELEARRRNSIVTDPLAWDRLPFTHGAIAALRTGDQRAYIPNPNPAEQATKSFLTNEEYRIRKLQNPDIYGYEPFAFSPEIAAWRNMIALLMDPDDASYHQDKLNDLVDGLIASLTAETRPRNYIYPLFDEQPDGSSKCLYLEQDEWVLDQDDPLCDIYIPDDWTAQDFANDRADRLAKAKDSLARIAQDAAERVRVQQGLIENEGLLSETSLANEVFTTPWGGGPYLGEVRALVDAPLTAKQAAVYSIPNVLGMLDASQQASSLAGLDTPGNKQLVYRPIGPPECNDGIDNDGDGDTDTADLGCACEEDEEEGDYVTGGQIPPECQQGQTAGIQDGPGGRVLQAQTTSSPTPSPSYDPLNLFDPEKYPLYDAPKEPTSPAANLIQPHLEQGAVHALRVFTGGQFRPSKIINCGLTCP